MSKRGNKEFFKDIIEAIERIQRYTRNMSFEIWDLKFAKSLCLSAVKFIYIQNHVR